MAKYTCTLTYDGTDVVAQYAPSHGVGGKFTIGDQITFLSPDVDAELLFEKGSPFEGTITPTRYYIQQNGSLQKTIARSCFACQISAGEATGEQSFPTKGMPGTLLTHECRLTLVGGKVAVEFIGGKPLFYINDQIRFVNQTGTDVTLQFPLNSPFELQAGAHSYTLAAGAQMTKKIAHTCFKAKCGVQGVPLGDKGPCVPTETTP